MKNKISVFWFRRDLRLEDNKGLCEALQSGKKIVPLFIFDENILENLPKNDARVRFIYETLKTLNETLKKYNSSLLIKKGKPIKVWQELASIYQIETVYTNKDYEPYAIDRDQNVEAFLTLKNIAFKTYKDQVIFEENEICKNDGSPYTVYTPYKNKWLHQFIKEKHTEEFKINYNNFYSFHSEFPALSTIGFTKSNQSVKDYNLLHIKNYDEVRDYPYLNKTSCLSVHLRFGLVSIRKMVLFAIQTNAVFLSELIWREFFMQILFHFPKVVTNNFKKKYDAVIWRNNEIEFNKWCTGETGYPLVDAGMRELNQTGYMHNRVRMITAGFLCKHLLIDWRWGEAYFAEKLLDYDLSANNGNWQWAAGTGCDAAPYFRIFNPSSQIKKFDKDFKYIKKWVPEFQELTYPNPIVAHKHARERCLAAYKKALNH